MARCPFLNTATEFPSPTPRAPPVIRAHKHSVSVAPPRAVRRSQSPRTPTFHPAADLLSTAPYASANRLAERRGKDRRKLGPTLIAVKLRLFSWR